MMLDALLEGPVAAAPSIAVGVDVLTPHVGDYYRGMSVEGENDAWPAPAEYWQPVPVPFLTVNEGRWLAIVIGASDDVAAAVELLRDAVQDRGIGAKTAAGYGYLTAGRPIAIPQGAR